MANFIIGTAGHVDHGKTMLVKALTGKDTDRLKEEKERGISIELGFAPLHLPGGQVAGIVDVPGHERFIKQMLAGVGGIDLVLLVIAADEGVMPQTREHLDIIQLLHIPRGIVVLTKADLVDEEWLALVKEEVQGTLQGTVLKGAPMVPVSSVTGQGLPELLKLIEEISAQIPERLVTGKARMPIDRVFSVTGFGTVVTGTLLSGQLKTGDEVIILPQGLTSKVRGIQVHGRKRDLAQGGQRVAINLSGVEVDQVDRGSVLAEPGALQASYRLDLHLELLQTAGNPLENRTRVRFYLGTKETFGRITLLDREELEPGEKAFAQISLEEPVAAAKKDRFVIRTYSPMTTIGGGVIVDPAPPKRKRYREEVLRELATKLEGTADELLLQYLAEPRHNMKTLEELAQGTGLNLRELAPVSRELAEKGMVTLIPGEGKEYLVATDLFRVWQAEIQELLAGYHKEYPLRVGMAKEDIRSRKFFFLNTKIFNYLLQAYVTTGVLQTIGHQAALAGFTPTPDSREAKLLVKIEGALLEGAFQPPGWKELAGSLGLNPTLAGELMGFLLTRGAVVKIDDDIYFHREILAQARERLIDYLKVQGNISLGQFRDLLGTSRKYTLPLLEYFDREKVTRRTGDIRVLY